MSGCTKHGHRYSCAACVQESADAARAALLALITTLTRERDEARADVTLALRLRDTALASNAMQMDLLEAKTNHINLLTAERDEARAEVERLIRNGAEVTGALFQAKLDQASATLAGIRAGLEAVQHQPSEEMWGGLARDIIMWSRMYEGSSLTPRNLFTHLGRIGTDIPQWLRDESEMQNLDHVPSKGTQAVIIYKAMIRALSPQSILDKLTKTEGAE